LGARTQTFEVLEIVVQYNHTQYAALHLRDNGLGVRLPAHHLDWLRCIVALLRFGAAFIIGKGDVVVVQVAS
jgi:hypothetical protein